MGQYYKVVNVDKKQYLHPHRFGDGLKLLEFGCGSEGTMTGLAVLLADGNGRGGGDLHADDPIIGSWAGDRIVIAGDYADPNIDQYSAQDLAAYRKIKGVFEEASEAPNLFKIASELYEDISYKVANVLKKDAYIARNLAEREKLFKPV